MRRYKIRCQRWNDLHTIFAVFDPVGANCGELTILTDLVVHFIQTSWKDDIEWDNKIPTVVMNETSVPQEESK